MPTPEEARRQKIAAEIMRRSFEGSGPPEVHDTLMDFRRLYAIAAEHAAEYRQALPFPHLVIEDFLPAESFRAVHDSLPSVDDPAVSWGNLEAKLPDGRPAQRLKYHLQNVLFMKPKVRELMAELNSGPFMVFLQRLTGIEPLLPDAFLQGGGVHVVKPGGSLRVHADFNKHPTSGMDRKLNLLLYMNEDWPEEYGGHLELWDQDMAACRKRVLPSANRCVIFNTDSNSFHGHPRPLPCPGGRERRSLATYYYRPGDDSRIGHATLWQDLPEERPQG